jgi:hypothetical protein
MQRDSALVAAGREQGPSIGRGGGSEDGARPSQFDWRLNSSAASLNAWVALGRLSWFHPAH